MTNAVKYYKDVLHEANMNVEAIACIATNYFYTDQPEIALKFYRCKTSTLLDLSQFLLFGNICRCYIVNLAQCVAGLH